MQFAWSIVLELWITKINTFSVGVGGRISSNTEKYNVKAIPPSCVTTIRYTSFQAFSHTQINIYMYTFSGYLFCFLAALGLCCFVRSLHWLWRAEATFFVAALHFSLWRLLLWWSTGSRRERFSSCSAQAQYLWLGLSYSTTCGILPDLGSNACPLHGKQLPGGVHT